MGEKETDAQVECPEEPDNNPHADSEVLNCDRDYERKLMRKVNWRLLPILGSLYAVSLIDRVNVCSTSLTIMRSLSDSRQ
jgi:hypothetical protein